MPLNIWAIFVPKLGQQELSKIAQSGHTGPHKVTVDISDSLNESW